jgi:hypothetical protein
MPLVKLITFGDGNVDFELATIRLMEQSQGFTQIQQRKIYTKADLDLGYQELFSENIRNIQKGFGLWSWKPYIIKGELDYLEENDVLIYLDAGCELNDKYQENLNYYLDFVARNNVLAFPMKHLNIQYSKPDPALIRNDSTYFRTQVGANVLFFLNTNLSRKFVNTWLNLCANDGGALLLESVSGTFDLDDKSIPFIAHRHDQSIFNRVYYDFNFQPYFSDETYNSRLYKLREKPILAIRNRGGKSKINILTGQGTVNYVSARIFYFFLPFWVSIKNRLTRLIK